MLIVAFYSIYGTTVPAGPWHPSEDASILCILLFSSILVFLGSVIFPSRQHPSCSQFNKCHYFSQDASIPYLVLGHKFFIIFSLQMYIAFVLSLFWWICLALNIAGRDEQALLAARILALISSVTSLVLSITVPRYYEAPSSFSVMIFNCQYFAYSSCSPILCHCFCFFLTLVLSPTSLAVSFSFLYTSETALFFFLQYLYHLHILLAAPISEITWVI